MMKRRQHDPMPDMRISLTSLLDLVFNILAFFVMTYVPPLAVRDYQVSLPPPKETPSAGPATEAFSFETPELFKDLTVVLESVDDGSLGGIVVEGRQVSVATGRQGPLEDEIRRLRRIIGDLEAVNIVAPAGLKYRYLVGVVEACQEAGIRQINFVGGSKKG